MTAFQFLMYCMGFGVIIISIGFAIYLARKSEISSAQVEQHNVKSIEPHVDALALRAKALQEARYALPFVLSKNSLPVRRQIQQMPVLRNRNSKKDS